MDYRSSRIREKKRERKRANSLMVEQRSPKSLARVRFSLCLVGSEKREKGERRKVPRSMKKRKESSKKRERR